MSYYDDEIEEDAYADWGSRDEYLIALADDYGLDTTIVFTLADALGANEDFDGLICELEDLMYYDQF